MAADEKQSLGRVYDKGERRYKHVGRNPYPEFRFEHDPKRRVGLCPNNLDSADHARLLNDALPEANGDRSIDIPKRLYAVHDGAIYRAETTDWGKSYHGYPYKGKLGRDMCGRLREMAAAQKCLEAFEDWMDEHIEIQGK